MQKGEKEFGLDELMFVVQKIIDDVSSLWNKPPTKIIMQYRTVLTSRTPRGTAQETG